MFFFVRGNTGCIPYSSYQLSALHLEVGSDVDKSIIYGPLHGRLRLDSHRVKCKTDERFQSNSSMTGERERVLMSGGIRDVEGRNKNNRAPLPLFSVCLAVGGWVGVFQSGHDYQAMEWEKQSQ